MSLSLLLSNVQVTGSALIYQANFSGIGGTKVFQSGSYILVSGGAGGGSVTQAQLNSLSGFTTGISGYLQQQIAMTSAGVSSLNGLSGTLNIIGTGGLTIINNGQNILISGNSWATSGNLSNTGQALYIMLTGLSGSLLGSIIASGNTAISHANSIGSILSGNIQQTGSNLYNLIVNTTGNFVPTGSILSYLTGIPTGSDKIFFNFLNYTFSSIPKVVATMETEYNNCGYYFMISGRSTTGFWALFSDTILESGFSLNVIAKN